MAHPSPTFRSLDTCPRTSKGWGEEVAVVNLDYCGKLLKFRKGARLSCHLHPIKQESFLISSGRILFRYIDTSDASTHERVMTEGDIVDIPRLLPHQVEALEDSVVTEFSTHHEDSDSLRVRPGDSQKAASDTAVRPSAVPTIKDDLHRLNVVASVGLEPSDVAWSNLIFNDQDEMISTGTVYKVTHDMMAAYPKRAAHWSKHPYCGP